MSDIHRKRVEALRAGVMEPLRLDLLLAYADDPLFPGAVRYLAGFDVYAMYALVAVPRRGDVVLAFGLHHSAYLVRVKEAAVADHYVGVRAPGAAVAELLAELPQGRKPRVGTIGQESMFALIDADLAKVLAAAEIVPADAAFREFAAGLDESGLADHRRAVRIVGAALEAGVRAFRGGGTLGDIAVEAGDAARRGGADIVNRELVAVRAASALPLPPHLAPVAGSGAPCGGALALEVSASFRGMRAVATRTVLSDEWEAPYSAALARVASAHRRIVAAVEAGATGGEIHARAAAILAEAGLGAPPVSVGHGIGYDRRQPPAFTVGDVTRLVADSAAVLRTGVTVDGLGAVHWADTMLVPPVQS